MSGLGRSMHRKGKCSANLMTFSFGLCLSSRVIILKGPIYGKAGKQLSKTII